MPRKMISEGIVNEKRVEVFPLCLKLIDSRDNSQTVIRLSKKVVTAIFFCISVSVFHVLFLSIYFLTPLYNAV